MRQKAFYSIMSHDTFHLWKWFELVISPFFSAVVLCPLSVTDGWVSEMAKFAPKLKVLKYVGEKEHRRSLRKTMYEQVIEKSSLSDVSICS